MKPKRYDSPLEESINSHFEMYHDYLSVLHDASNTYEVLEEPFPKYVFHRDVILDAPDVLEEHLRIVARGVLQLGSWRKMPKLLAGSYDQIYHLPNLTTRPDGSLPNPITTPRRLRQFASGRIHFSLDALMDGVSLDPIFLSYLAQDDVSA
jgi:hypothetical protein